jgi:hypothetical protein
VLFSGKGLRSATSGLEFVGLGVAFGNERLWDIIRELVHDQVMGDAPRFELTFASWKG